MNDIDQLHQLHQLLVETAVAPWHSVPRGVYSCDIENDHHVIAEHFSYADALLIVAMRNTMPALFDRLAAAEAKAERLAKALTAQAVEHEDQAEGRSAYAKVMPMTYHAEQAKIARAALNEGGAS